MSSLFKIQFFIGIIFSISISCQRAAEQETVNTYFDVVEPDTNTIPGLYAVTDEEFLQYGANLAYLDVKGDTIIPFGRYAYFGTDTLKYYANVIERQNDGRQVGIDRQQRILFDLVMFDNGPDPSHDGLTRVLRNGKMGYADEIGRVVIPCIYDYAKQFENGTAEVTFDADKHQDEDGHLTVNSSEWFTIDKTGKRITD